MSLRTSLGSDTSRPEGRSASKPGSLAVGLMAALRLRSCTQLHRRSDDERDGGSPPDDDAGVMERPMRRRQSLSVGPHLPQKRVP